MVRSSPSSFSSQPASARLLHDADELGLSDIVARLKAGRVDIVASVIVCILFALMYGVLTPPHYAYDAVIHINPATSDFASETSLGSEIAIVQSSSLIGETLDALGPPVDVQISNAPYIENILGVTHPDLPKTSLMIERFDVPDEWLGHPFRVTALGENQFKLHSPKGATASIKLEGKHIRKGQEFTLIPRHREAYIKQLKLQLNARYKSLNAPNIMQLTFSHSNPAYAHQFLNKLVERYMSQTRARQAAKANQSVFFLEQAMARDKAELDLKETKLKALRERHGFFDIDANLQFILGQLADTENRLEELMIQFEDTKSYYTSAHPVYIAMNQQVSALRARKVELGKEIKALPRQQIEFVDLTRDIETLAKRYEDNVRGLNEQKVIAASVPGYARIIDLPASQASDVSPNLKRILFIAAMLGIIVSTFWVVLRDSLVFAKALRMETIQKHLGSPVLGYLACGTSSSARAKSYGTEFQSARLTDDLHAIADQLGFLIACTRPHSVGLTTTSNGLHSASISCELARQLAGGHEKVLLLDANLNQPRCHRLLDINGEHGLTSYVAGKSTLEQAVQKTKIDNLYLLPAGNRPPNASSILAHESCHRLLDALHASYDRVIIDMPHILAQRHPEWLARLGGVVPIIPYRSSLIESARFVHDLKHENVNIAGCIISHPDTLRGEPKR